MTLAIDKAVVDVIRDVGDVVLGHPGMLQDLLEADPGVLVDGQAGLDEVGARG